MLPILSYNVNFKRVPPNTIPMPFQYLSDVNYTIIATVILIIVLCWLTIHKEIELGDLLYYHLLTFNTNQI